MNLMIAMMGPGEAVEHVEDRTIDAGETSLGIRIYRPSVVVGRAFQVGDLRSADHALTNTGWAAAS